MNSIALGHAVPHVLAALAYLCVAAQTPPSKFFILNAVTNSHREQNNVVDHIGNTAGTLVTWVLNARRWGPHTSPARNSGDRSGR